MQVIPKDDLIAARILSFQPLHQAAEPPSLNLGVPATADKLCSSFAA